MSTKMTIHLLLLGLLAVSVANAARNAPSRELLVEGPPVRFRECDIKFGPWPPTVPQGSSGWSDGRHDNMSTFLISFTDTGIKGIKTQWVSFLTSDPTIPSYATFSHGKVTGKRKAQFKWEVNNPNNTPFVRLGGTYNDKYGLDTISFIDSNNNQYTWGNAGNPGPHEFFSPADQGYIVGLFGANNKTHLTQIGVCMSGPK